MANWGRIGSRGNVEDRRGMRPILVGGGGIGITSLVILLALNYLGGGEVTDVLEQIQVPQVPIETMDRGVFEGADSYEVFASTVLGSNNDMWQEVFARNGKTYTPPKLVLFRQATQSACGFASSEVGPHYCPNDRTIYLDETFFQELEKRFGAQGGDVAEAYVIAHEVGHHAQNELGLLGETGSQEESIAQELQADCFAGLWAHSVRDVGVFEEGEIAEAMDAAAAVGDDRIQQAVEGSVHPESWTHGSSQQRQYWFNQGYQTGNVSTCTP